MPHSAGGKVGVTLEQVRQKDNGLRPSGIDVLGNAKWGTHFCQFYHTPEDLLDILVPYFKAGLENNEYCMWVTSKPLEVAEAKNALRKAVPDFEHYAQRNQIEIISYTDWYTKGGGFHQERVLNGWVEKLNKALEAGFDGLRLTGNTFWLEKKDWESFAAYEKTVNDVIGNFKMLALCTYSLETCGASEIIDVVSNHQFALAKKSGRWQILESAEHKKAMEKLRQHADKLDAANKELLRFNRLMVGRELRMMELKHEVNALCQQFGQPLRYPAENPDKK